MGVEPAVEDEDVVFTPDVEGVRYTVSILLGLVSHPNAIAVTSGQVYVLQ